jgi:V/A-type H+-transporting ATPase subunit I
MELLSLAILRDKTEAVVSHLLRMGVFHPVDIRNIERELAGLSIYQIEQEHIAWEALEMRLKNDLRKLGLSLVPVENPEVFSDDKIKTVLDSLEGDLAALLGRKEELLEELKTKESIFSQIKEYFALPVKKGSLYTFIEVTLGKIREENMPVLERSLKNIPHLVYPLKRESGMATALLIGLKRDRVLLDNILKDLAWQKVDYPDEHQGLSGDVQDKLHVEIQVCKAKLEETNRQIKATAEIFREDLAKIYSFTVLKRSLLEAKKYSCTTEKTVLLSGWVPQQERVRVVAEIKKIAGTSYVEEKAPEELDVPKDEIPVQLKRNFFFKPFGLLVDSYGIPRYGTVDPTIFVAISFLLMFGAMFGDVGHGAVLCVVSLFLSKGKKEVVRQAGALIRYCGVSSCVFGLLYGSAFGFEFPSLWLKPMASIFKIIRISVFFGIGMISLGIVFNVFNALRDKDYIKAIFDKAGLIAGVVYWAGIGLVSKSFMSKSQVPPAYGIVLIVGLTLLFLKPLAEFIFRKRQEGIFISFTESAVDILEVVMGYLANTVSFLRIAAFSLAHAGLFLAIFELSRIERDVAGGFLSVLTIILGNAFAIVLEGLVVGIQSVRLNYYEFFSKFFISGKELYKPLTISAKS